MFGVILLLANIFLANGVYFTMRNIQTILPTNPGNYPLKNVSLVTLYASNTNLSNNFLHYSTNDESENGIFQIIPGTSDVIFNNLRINNIKNLSSIAINITVKDSIGSKDQTSFEVDVLAPLDCDRIVQDLCYWKSVEYRIYENSVPTLVGSLASPYLVEMCTKFKINYTLENDTDEFELVPPTSDRKSWSIRTLKRLDRDLQVLRKPLSITCIVENSQKIRRSVEKAVRVQILDINDNLPEAQKAEFNIGVKSNSVIKGQLVEHKELIFIDKDTSAVNGHQFTIVNDSLGILGVKCKNYPHGHERETQTVVHCHLEFTKSMQIPFSSYSVTLQLNDTSIVNGNSNSLVKVPIHLHFLNESGYHPVMTKRQTNRPLILYPAHVAKVFRTAAPLARITQPTHNKDAINFTIQANPLIKDIFGITYASGIVFVHNVRELRKSSEYVWLNISWMRNKVREFDEIQVRIIDESTRTCVDMTDSVPDDWMFCSEYDNSDDCESKDACAISTGGAPSVARRKAPERCMWRGDKHPGNITTHMYATCTPDIATCPDGVCDDLELLHDRICPQDCAKTLLFPAAINEKTGRGIDRGNGVCHCDQRATCTCTPYKKKNKKKQFKENNKKTTTVASTISQANVSRHISNGSSERIEIAKCGTTCLLGIVAGSLFLIGAITLVVICWRLDRVRKAVRGKFSDETQDLSAPLSDYVDRSVPEPMPINFDLTTTLSDPLAFNAIKKYTPDPKWEFPRNQLTIEQTLGEGEFGRVLRAKALNIAGQTGYTTVAVKTLKDDARETELNDLLSEYQLLKEVSHPNVIRLLGVCTTPGGPVYLIIEFAEHGSLRNYLRRSRHLKSEMGRLPSSTGCIDDSDVHYDQPNVSKVTPKEILSFGWQICKGMAYLSEIKLVHRDLAARNVLLATNKICKISDFGLTRDIYEDDAYFKRSKGRVPVKWMAPESLSDHIYTNKSDVWSFGILVWELVTLGAAPYPGIAVQNLFHLLKQGYRMERPDNCSPTLYNIMRSCWHIDPEQRPTFQELSALWEKMLGDEVEYLDLTNNAIHNRSYFCSPFEQQTDNELLTTKLETNPLNYLSKSQPYVKCGSTDKFIQESNILAEHDNNQNDINTKGYETPVKVVKRVTTPTNECPQYYTDMDATKKD